MFSKSKPARGSASSTKMGASKGSFSVIGSDVVITGDVVSATDLHIDGAVTGNIRCASLSQGAGSVIKGNVEGETLHLAGRVEGSILCKALVVESSAHIAGEVRYESLSIAQGGQVEGQLKHQDAAAIAPLKLVSHTES